MFDIVLNISSNISNILSDDNRCHVIESSDNSLLLSLFYFSVIMISSGLTTWLEY